MKRMNALGKVIALSTSCAILVGLLFWYFSGHRAPAPEPKDLARCFSGAYHTNEPCIQGTVSALLQTYSAENLLRYVVATSSPQAITSPYICHLIAHTIGDDLYRKTGSLEAAFGQCSSACQNGCIHGVVIAGFAAQLGALGVPDADSSADALVHDATVGTVVQLGKRFCQTSTLCHGLGHIFLDTFNDYTQALSACDAAGALASSTQTERTRRESCYEGVFMEGVDADAQLQLGNEASGYPKLSCDSVGPQYMLACFRFLPAQLAAASESAPASCMRFSGLMRSDCVEGVGYFWGLSLPDPNAMPICTFPEQSDRIACDIGVTLGISVRRRFDQSIRYCDVKQDPIEKKACYGAAFQNMDTYGGAGQECAGASSTACSAQFAEYQTYKSALPFYLTDHLPAS